MAYLRIAALHSRTCETLPEKRAGFKLIQKDVFLNIAGGLKVNDPAIDLAVISAILSSSLDIKLGRVADFTQAILTHLINTQFSRAAETVFDTPENTVHIMLIAFKLKNGVGADWR